MRPPISPRTAYLFSSYLEEVSQRSSIASKIFDTIVFPSSDSPSVFALTTDLLYNPQHNFQYLARTNKDVNPVKSSSVEYADAD